MSALKKQLEKKAEVYIKGSNDHEIFDMYDIMSEKSPSPSADALDVVSLGNNSDLGAGSGTSDGGLEHIEGKHKALIDMKQTIITDYAAADFLYHPETVLKFESYVSKACNVDITDVKIVGVTDKLLPNTTFNPDGSILIEYCIIIHYTIAIEVRDHNQRNHDQAVEYIRHVVGDEIFTTGLMKEMRTIHDLSYSRAPLPDLPLQAKLVNIKHESLRKNQIYFGNNKSIHNLNNL